MMMVSMATVSPMASKGAAATAAATRTVSKVFCPRRWAAASTMSSSAAWYHSSPPTFRASRDDNTTGTRTTTKITTPSADPAMRQYKFWNREESVSEKGKFSYLIEISPESIQREARILSLSDPDDDANALLHRGPLPLGASVLAVGTTMDDFGELVGKPREQQPNVLFVSPSCPHTATVLPQVLRAFPSIQWAHCRSAGIDFVESNEFSTVAEENGVEVTNAKGQFSSTLAEYAMLACSYFSKDIPRLVQQQREGKWMKYNVQELRGKTMGIVGYGDVGRACAKLASVYGMRIVALRRHPDLSRNDPLCDVVYGRDNESLYKLMGECDYVVCSAPSTVETRGMVNAAALDAAKESAVFINLGRGRVVDEDALTEALRTKKLRGAALDVFREEPLPSSSPLWEMDNVLISPHNMDQTATFMHEATEFFVNENLPRFLFGEELLNPVDPKLGY